jgi:hypothetical protein
MNTPFEKKLSLKAFCIITLIPIFSLIFLAIDHNEIITGTTTMHGFRTIAIILPNIIGMALLGILAYPFHGSHAYSFTLTLWISVILLNWIALLVIYYLGGCYRNSTNKNVKKVGAVLCWIWIIWVIFDAENKVWHLIDIFKNWMHA